MSATRRPVNSQSFARPRPDLVSARYQPSTGVPRPRPDVITPQYIVGARQHASASQQRYASRAVRPEPVQHIGKYRVIKTIGKGNFAVVKLAKHVPTGRMVAIKIIDKTQLSPSSLQKMCREVRIMKCLDHPNIVKLFEVMETPRTMYLVLEYASGGEIFDYLVSHGRMKESDARAKFRQIVSAVQYCHEKCIVHRDLKAENLLLDRDMNIKLADFGFCNEFSFGDKLSTFCGSPPYAAPELFQGRKYTGPEVDIWSLGVILFTLITGSLPFDGHNLKELKEHVIKGKYQVPFYFPSDCQRLLKKLLVLNPSKRITLETAMKDKWLNSGYSGEELRPYLESLHEWDEERIDLMTTMGFNREQIYQSLGLQSYDDIWATYHLLGVKVPFVSNPMGDAVFGRPVRRTASDLTSGQNYRPSRGGVRKMGGVPDIIRLDGVVTTLNEIPDDGDISLEPVMSPVARQRPTVDSDCSYLGNESPSPHPGNQRAQSLENTLGGGRSQPPRRLDNIVEPQNVNRMLSFAGAKEEQKPEDSEQPVQSTPSPVQSPPTVTDSSEPSDILSSTPPKIPLVALKSSPTARRRRTPQVSTDNSPVRTEHSPTAVAGRTPVWVPSSVPTQLLETRRYQRGTGSEEGLAEERSRVFESLLSEALNQNGPGPGLTGHQQFHTPTYSGRSASFATRPVPSTNLTKRLGNVPAIPEAGDTSTPEKSRAATLPDRAVVGTRIVPPLLSHKQDTTRLGSGRFQSFRGAPPSGVAASNFGTPHQGDATSVIGVAETAPPWHVKSIPSGRPPALHDSGYASASGSRFSRNVATRQTVHGVSVSRQPQIPRPPSPSSTGTLERTGFVCGSLGKGHHHHHPSFFSRLAAKFGRKKNQLDTSAGDVRVTSV